MQNRFDQNILDDKSYKLNAASFEQIENFFIPNYSKILFSNTLMTAYEAKSVNTADSSVYCLQKIKNIPRSYVDTWIERWKYMIEMAKVDLSGVLKYLACHFEKTSNDNEKINVNLISEYTTGTLREAKSKFGLNMSDIVRAMLQVSETLLKLKALGYSHRAINPDAIFVVENKDRTYSYKLGNFGEWMNTQEVKYHQRPEYSHTIPKDYHSDGPISKSDVYSLGMTIIEIIGVNVEVLNNYTIKASVAPSYSS